MEDNLIRLEIPANTYVKYYMKKKGYPLKQPCHGKAECAECLIRVCEGNLVPSLSDILRLDEKTLAKGYRLGCKAVTAGDPITIEFSPNVIKRKGEHSGIFSKIFGSKS